MAIVSIWKHRRRLQPRPIGIFAKIVRYMARARTSTPQAAHVDDLIQERRRLQLALDLEIQAQHVLVGNASEAELLIERVNSRIRGAGRLQDDQRELIEWAAELRRDIQITDELLQTNLQTISNLQRQIALHPR